MKSSVLHISAVCHASPMHVSDKQLESLWSTLVNKDGTRAPSDVVLAFASLGGSDAEAVYCISWAEQQTEFWLVLAVDGDFLVYVSADGGSLWRGDEDRPAESLEASPLQFAPMCLPSGSRNGRERRRLGRGLRIR